MLGADSVMIDLRDKKVVVVGLAMTGISIARYCRNRGARVLVLEQSLAPADPDQAKSLLSMGVEIRYGAHDSQALDHADLVVPSPGVPPATPILQRALKRGLPVISEIELAFLFTTRPVIAVTGTNGKTTTTTLIGEIFDAAGRPVDVCGNIGRPMIDVPGLDVPSDIPLVVEVSSFQLEFTDKFKPDIGVLLNVSPDHLDWHENMEDYENAKLKMFRRQTSEDWSVVNFECVPLVASSSGQRLVFGGYSGVFVRDGWIAHDFRRKTTRIVPVDELSIRGQHNVSNAMAAAAVALIEGIDEDVIAEALRRFNGVEHRLEPVMHDSGILFYNDSKATNPAAAMTALRAFDGAIIMLAGGRNKGNSFEELAKEARGRVKLAILFGESASDLSAALTRYSVPVTVVDSLGEAVHAAVGAAGSGDVVLLAPACASFDMFSDYEARGRAFKAAVRAEVESIGAT